MRTLLDRGLQSSQVNTASDTAIAPREQEVASKVFLSRAIAQALANTRFETDIDVRVGINSYPEGLITNNKVETHVTSFRPATQPNSPVFDVLVLVPEGYFGVNPTQEIVNPIVNGLTRCAEAEGIRRVA